MAKRLPAKLAEATVPVEVVAARAEEIPFPDASFDAVVSTFVLCSVDEPAAGAGGDSPGAQAGRAGSSCSSTSAEPGERPAGRIASPASTASSRGTAT